jgi:hypothetical protein
MKIIATAVALVLAVLCCGGYYWGTEKTMTCTVTEKDRAKDANGASDMRLYTDECGVLKVEDAFLRGNFDSADDYAAIETGQSYEFTTIGWRVPFLSMFPAVIEYREAK